MAPLGDNSMGGAGLSSGTDLLYALEKAANQVIRALAPEGGMGSTSAHMVAINRAVGHVIEAGRDGADGDALRQALDEVEQVLLAARPHLPRGGESSQQMSLALWICDACRRSFVPGAALGPPNTV